MSLIILNVDEVRRTLSASGGAFVAHDKEIDIVRFAINTGFTDVVLDENTALRVMYQRPGESQVRAQTLTYYDTDGLHNYYDWQLSQSDLAKNGSLTVALCILRTDSEVEEWHTTPCAVRVLSTIHTDDSDEGDETITPTVAQRVAVLETMIQRVASGAPIVVASTSAMTDTEQIYVLSTDGHWYYHNGSAWTAGGEYGGVAAGSVTTDKLANKSVTTAKLDDSSVTWQKLASGAVHTGELADGAVTNVKLADSSVSEEKLASSAVTATKLADGAVTTAKIADGAVTANKIASGVIPNTDTTLTQSGIPADAKTVGDKINNIESAAFDTSIFNWTFLGSTNFPTGFRMGQWSSDTGLSSSSSYQCRSINFIPYTKNTKQLIINSPDGFSAKFTEYDRSGNFIRAVGRVAYHYSSGVVAIDVVQGNQYQVTVGWWSTAMTDADLTDAMFTPFTLTIVNVNDIYDLYPSNDTTNRIMDIYMLLSKYGICRLAPGDYYIGRLKMPENVILCGAGKEKTRLISTIKSTEAYVLNVGVNSKISELTLEYATEGEPVPTATYKDALHGIVIGTTGSTDIPSYNVTIENVEIKKFPGCGLFLRRIGLGTDGTSLKNVKVSYCSVGFYFGSRAEYNVVSACYAYRCYTGMIVMGGNNIIADSVIGECENGFILDKVDDYGAAGNDAHGIINGCKITHIGYFNNNGLAIKSEGQQYGMLITNCMLNTDILVKDREKAMQFVGCQFRSGNNITIDNSIVSIFSSMFYSGSNTGISVLNGGLLKRLSCIDYEGNLLTDVS